MLTRGAFEAWLGTFEPDEIVGLSWDWLESPLAQYLASLGVEDVAFEDGGYTAYYGGWYVEAFEEWVLPFMAALDNPPDRPCPLVHEVTAPEALAALR